jgi:hypothetical protein
VKGPHFSPFASEPEFEDEHPSPGKAKVAVKPPVSAYGTGPTVETVDEGRLHIDDKPLQAACHCQPVVKSLKSG